LICRNINQLEISIHVDENLASSYQENAKYKNDAIKKDLLWKNRVPDILDESTEKNYQNICQKMELIFCLLKI